MSQIRIDVPELGLTHEATPPAEHLLDFDVRRTRGRGGHGRAIASKVSLGGPDAARMRPREDEDPAMADRRAGSEFWSVLMSLTIEPAEDETLASAWLQVDLAATGGGTPPIAFAMQPSRQEAGVDVQAGGGAEVNAQVLKISGSAQRSYTIQEAEVLALRRLQSNPAWEITPSAGRAIQGGADFVLVAKAPTGTRGTGRITFGAEIEWVESGFLRSHRGEVSWSGDPVSFTLD